MEIKDIKQQLSIKVVLEHYGVKADKNGMAKCPFHPDKTPSLQIYPKSNPPLPQASRLWQLN